MRFVVRDDDVRTHAIRELSGISSLVVVRSCLDWSEYSWVIPGFREVTVGRTESGAPLHYPEDIISAA